MSFSMGSFYKMHDSNYSCLFHCIKIYMVFLKNLGLLVEASVPGKCYCIYLAIRRRFPLSRMTINN